MIEDINNLTSKVLGLAFEVHTQLGAGLLESTYESCLFYELRANDIDVERQKKLPIIYKGTQLDTDYRIDLLIDNQLIIELKSVEMLQPVSFCPTIDIYETWPSKIWTINKFQCSSFKTRNQTFYYLKI